MQERSHAFAMKSQVWLLDPRPDLPSIVKAVEDGFELSEVSNTPVMMEVRIRCCHVHGKFIAKDNKRPAMTVADALDSPRRDTGRIVLPPASFLHEKEKISKRWPAAVDFIRSRKINGVLRSRPRRDRHRHAGRHVQRRHPRACSGSASPTPMATPISRSMCSNAVYPLIDDEFLVLLRGQGRRAGGRGRPAQLHRAGASPRCCTRPGAARGWSARNICRWPARYTGQVMLDGARRLPARRGAVCCFPPRCARPTRRGRAKRSPISAKSCRGRPPRLLHRLPRAADLRARRSWSSRNSASTTSPADIGCHLFSIMPPFELGATTMGYGLGPASALGLQLAGRQTPLHLLRRRRRLLAQRPDLLDRQRRLQQERRRHRHRRQFLLGRDRRAGHPVVARASNRTTGDQASRSQRRSRAWA